MSETLPLTVYRRRDLPRIRREWQGDTIRLVWSVRRGNYRRATRTAEIVGVLTNTSPEHITLDTPDGPRRIHYSRVLSITNLSRRDYAEECRLGLHGDACESNHIPQV
jgi:hypothetical protein